MKRIVLSFKSVIIRVTLKLMNLNSRICYADMNHDIGWHDHLRWWIEARLDTVFSWAYEGSDEELQAVLLDEIPLEHMNERQLNYAAQLAREAMEGVQP